MGIFGYVKRQFAITDHGCDHIREFMDQLSGEVCPPIVIRVLENRPFVFIFVLGQKPRSLPRFTVARTCGSSQ